MAVRAVNTRPLFLSAAPFTASWNCSCRCTTLQPPNFLKFCIRSSVFCSKRFFFRHGASFRSYSVQSLVDTVIQELASSRRLGRAVSVSNKLVSTEELSQIKVENLELKKGLLLEFKKDTEKILLAVTQRPDGKKNWMVFDQNGVTSSIKPQQITFIVPGIEDFDHSELSIFKQRAEKNLDPSLLEFAWIELVEKNKSVTVQELAEMIFGSDEPLESYCAHLLLSNDGVYFTLLEKKGNMSIYGPRSAVQVQEILQKKLAEEAAEKEFQNFICMLKSAKEMPSHAKPSKSSWRSCEKIWNRIESLHAFGIDSFVTDSQKKTAGLILKAMKLANKSSAAVNLLIDIGYFPVHVNLDVLKHNIRIDFPEKVLSAAENLLSESCDPDKDNRVDLTHLKVYAIDVDEADELDDALSATRLQDGRIKVWIHVADPTSLVQAGSIIEKEALRRGTSVFLPTATYPMFPEKLAMEGMSLKQGKTCNAVTVSAILSSDGSIAEYSVENSIIRPTYMLTYETASELLHLNLEEEAELQILSEGAALRSKWRRGQGAIDTATMEARVKVVNPQDPEPSIRLYVENQADPAMRLVSEMMILCGEVIATYGSQNYIPLPYRGQPQSNIDESAFAHLPEGPVRTFAITKIMRAAEMDFGKPIWHGMLGLPGYVQFTSPIRRYVDLLAHYQVKAFLRGESPPFTTGQLEGIASMVNMTTRIVRKLSGTALRYWILEYLRQQPKERRFSALILKFIKDRTATVLLMEVGLQAFVSVSVGADVGQEVKVQVVVAHPRDDILSLREVTGV